MLRLTSCSALVAAAILLAVGCGSGSGQPASSPAVQAAPGPVLPEFKVKGLDGREHTLAETRGRVVLLDLFATWCPPCRLEIPHFVELQKKYGGRLQVVGLCYDQAPAAEVKNFLTQMKVTYPVYWGTEEIADHVSLRGIPTTLLLDRQGRVRQTYVGFTPKGIFERAVQTLLAEPEEKL